LEVLKNDDIGINFLISYSLLDILDLIKITNYNIQFLKLPLRGI